MKKISKRISQNKKVFLLLKNIYLHVEGKREETNQALICCVTLQKPTSARAVTGQCGEPGSQAQSPV